MSGPCLPAWLSSTAHSAGTSRQFREAVIFHNALDIAEIVRQLLEEGWEIEPEDLAQISPYLTEHINRFGEYSTHELGIQPEAYDPRLDVDFTVLRGDAPTSESYSPAA
ncbi:Tn3 family transposase [Streptomyces incanus]|uniref:Tn3 family transposase n=1 Tax=Streptomyces incanus TaxID=887453 RepID=A0ABW0XLF2_9ACTN